MKDLSTEDLPELHVEIVQRDSSSASEDEVRELVRCALCAQQVLVPGTVLRAEQLDDGGALAAHVASVALCDAELAADVRPAQCRLRLAVCRVRHGREADALQDAGGEPVAAAEVWPLPHAELHGLWESLVFDDGIKRDLLAFVETALAFGAAGVCPLAVACNRVVLLHGPPGTGKTSLCRALAHKLAVRLAPRFPRARLLEINAHGLFSKWFSESGKLVARLFERVREVAADPRLLCVVLLDEAESLAAARRAAAAGLEPSDALRAVNALLTQLDRLRLLPNALLLATSNVPGALDAAFADRADLRRLVPAPGPAAAYRVLRGCCEELLRAGLVGPRAPLFSWRVLAAAGAGGARGPAGRLRGAALAAAARGLSGRALRRLPLLAAARLRLGGAGAAGGAGAGAATLEQFAAALEEALAQHVADAAHFDAAAAADVPAAAADVPAAAADVPAAAAEPSPGDL